MIGESTEYLAALTPRLARGGELSRTTEFGDSGEQLIVTEYAGRGFERKIAGCRVAHAVVAVSIHGALRRVVDDRSQASIPAIPTVRTGVGVGFAACEVDRPVTVLH